MTKNEETLFTVAMKGEWKEVLEICRQDVRALKLKITKSGATVLQAAVIESQVFTVRALLALIEENSVYELLRLENNGGDTALHLAASMGSVVMCRYIAEIDHSLVGVRNKSGETPLFLAVLHEKSTVFHYLNSLCTAELGYSYSRRKDGDTFLHCAIAGQYMVLAHQIIEKYPNLVHYVNEKRYTPLHVLATKPAAFKSGHRGLGRFGRFVYNHCISINQLEFPDEEDIINIADHGTDCPNKNQDEPLDKDEDNPKEVIVKAAEEEERKGQKGLLTNRGTVENQTPILIAAKNGIIEIVDAILARFPMAVNDSDACGKNIVILAIENRHVSLFNVLMKKNLLREGIVRKRDDEGNSALHLAAVYAKDKHRQIPSASAQMLWEIKWFEHVKSSLPPISFWLNYEEKTPEEMFTETHKELSTQGINWLFKASESCSVVAALIAGVAFATIVSIPGGMDESSGKPKLENQTAFRVFTISSLMALCFSVNSLIMFLTNLMSRFQVKDLTKDLPVKFLASLTSVFISIFSPLVSFSSGYFLVTEGKFRYAFFLVYVVVCLPISIFAFSQFPLYVDLVRTIFRSRFAKQE
ncbi:hypothetical protein FNV43_RR23344 [Rhamnella rubrinervis]|uniref:PGG domain-containing protein n=1 Tax=Rhamnella rubrinervis TaxID=2594499 RepID=A0A8K0E3M0_9ROSA|nr:hypothetical protein FNV43_RR23344 [Rhamnella rubrinervis]